MTMPNKFILPLLPALALAGCTPPAKAPPASPPAVLGPGAEEAAQATNASAMRLQDICAVMLLYVTQHQQLPPTLEDLRPLAGPDLQFVSPATGQPYVYVPAGLSVPGQERLLVLYDSVAAPNGWRWGIVVTPPAGNQPLTMLVVRLNEPVLKAYLQSAPAGR